MNSKKLAELLSIVLGPQVWLPVLIAAIFLRSNLSAQQTAIFLPTLLLFQFVIPIGYIVLAVRKGTVTAWDLPKREERYGFLQISFLSYVASLILIIIFGNQFLLHINLILFALLILFFLVTFFWKISFHSSLNTTGSLLVNFLYNWQLPWLYLSVPIVFWARLVLKRHTFLQLLAGSFLSGIVIIVALYYLNYI